MRIILSSATMLAVVCGLAPASLAQTPASEAAQTPQAAEAPKVKAKDDPDRVTCKRMVIPNKLPSAVINRERICHTRAEWDQLLKVNEEMMKKYKDAFRQGSPRN